MSQSPPPPHSGKPDPVADALDAALAREHADVTPPGNDAVLHTTAELGEASRPAGRPSPAGRSGLVIAFVAVVLALGLAAYLFLGGGSYVIDIRSMPEGASILLDGMPLEQRTPAVLTLRERPARIRLELDGYEPLEAAVTQEGRAIRLDHTLARLVSLESDPAGAVIVIDEIETGLRTPAAVSIRGDALPAIELRLDGYVPVSVPVTSELLRAGRWSGALTSLAAARAAKGTTVTVTGPYAFEVTGCEMTSTAAESHTVRVTSPCTLRFRAPELLLDTTRPVDPATAGTRMEIAVPPAVTVQLRSRFENCTLSIGGRHLGTPPVDVSVVEGQYSVTLQCPDGRTLKTRPFEIASGQTVRRVDEFLP
jgi:hypothetical protein